MRTLLAFVLLAAATAASAASLNVAGLSLGTSTGVVNLGGINGLNPGNYYAGPFDASLDGGATMRVFCGDLLDETRFDTPGNVSLVDTAAKGAGYGKAAQLLNRYAGSVGSDPVANAALQLAMWKSICPNLAYGEVTPGVVSLMTTYLQSDLSGYSDHATYYDFGGTNQSMIGVRIGNAQATPEPTALAALSVGALGLVRRRRRA